MDHFEYEPIELKDRSFRLVQLLGGDDGPIQCKLLNAWLHDTEDAIEYEALSYTWGNTDKLYEIEVNGRKMPITENLSIALQHLRQQFEDRILWIDAICINQENHKERGHQVRQMASIYKKARQVIIWLGQATYRTDLVFCYMYQLEILSLDHACNSWKASDKRWQFLWDSVNLLLRQPYREAEQEGFRTLLDRSWFRRVWILQEVASARSATVMCGTKSVSARIFAIVPPLVGVTPNPHCQAVLDIMPGPSRKYSWWTQNRDLHTLIRKFQKSEASDSRDIIYALLGISSDGCGTDYLVPNYEKSVQEVIHDTVVFLLHFRDWKTLPCLPQWTLLEFLQNLGSLESAVFIWAVQNRHEATVKLLLETSNVDVNSKDKNGLTPLWWAALHGHEATVKLLLETNNVDVDSKDEDGLTPLWGAIQNGHEAIVKLLLETGNVNVDLKDSSGRTPLWWAARHGHEATVKLLLETGNVDVNSKDWSGRTPLWWAALHGHEATVKLLLETGNIDVDLKDWSGRTPLWWAARHGHEATVKLLLETGNVDVNSKDKNGLTPLRWAVQNRHGATVKLLLETSNVDVNSKDEDGLTPLWGAVQNGHEAIVKLLLETGNVNVDLKDSSGRTPLWWAALHRHEEIAKLLLETGKADTNSEDQYKWTPLWWAVRNRLETIVKLLLKTSNVHVDSKDKDGLTPL